MPYSEWRSSSYPFACVLGVGVAISLLYSTRTPESQYQISNVRSGLRNASLITVVADPGYPGYDPFDVPYTQVQCIPCLNGTIVEGDIPLAIIGGAMKGGTRALLTYLGQHPQVYTNQGDETHIFDGRNVDIFKGKDDEVFDQCAVLGAFRDLFEKKRRHQPKGLGAFGAADLSFFDKSPSYLEASHIVPQRILCALPEAKVVFVLRNPVDRAYSHFQHCARKHNSGSTAGLCNGQTFEQFIDKDMMGLDRAGVLKASTPAEEYDAWQKYHGLGGKKKDFVLAKGLYSITLRQWIAVFRDYFGKDRWSDHILILESEYMHTNKQEAFDRTLDFLGLPRYVLSDDMEDYHVGHYEPMTNGMRERLEKFFRPYNQRLHKMLLPLGIEISWARNS